ncbi:CBS domain-containing protein [Devosia nitrariae]|uniref:CBS domain-containing protein n=1 Tax=Devosia nitrariae TaxID=2071872 RepID=A0ABQ5W9M7_9HYPH|nr:CBS domain-containing protein [Devosia nitrariae]GLQ56640.1 hypothetical protein GCM10010862_38990 [Devosia nitrariae]
MKAKDIMARQVVTLSPGNSVSHAARILLDHHISGAPVIDDENTLVGILTEGDLLRRTELGSNLRADLATQEGTESFIRSHSWRVDDVMTPRVVTIGENMPVGEIARLFETNKIKRVPVMRGERLAGIVSRADLLFCIAESRPERIAKGDQALRTSIAARLRDMLGTAITQPTVSVIEGAVHLWGSVRTDIERQAIRVVIEGVPGVKGIDDHMLCVGSAEADELRAPAPQGQ